MIEISIHETHLAVGGEGFRGAGIEVISLKLAILPVQKVVSVGRDAEGMIVDQLAFQHQLAFTRRSVDSIDIGRGGLVVGDVSARVASHRPAAIRRDVEVAHGFVRKLDEFHCGHVEGLAKSKIPILVRAHHL